MGQAGVALATQKNVLPPFFFLHLSVFQSRKCVKKTWEHDQIVLITLIRGDVR